METMVFTGDSEPGTAEMCEKPKPQKSPSDLAELDESRCACRNSAASDAGTA